MLYVSKNCCFGPSHLGQQIGHIFEDMKVALLSLRLKIPIKQLDLENSLLSSQILRVIIQQEQEAWAQIAGSQRRVDKCTAWEGEVAGDH